MTLFLPGCGRPCSLRTIVACAAVVVLATAACGGDSGSGSDKGSPTPGGGGNAPEVAKPGAPSDLKLTSAAFADGASVPARYTCSGDNTSPALSWSGAPDGTGAFALLMDDPDAPGRTFDHWVVYDLPGSASGLPESVPSGETLAGGGRQGKNGAGTPAYMGPCPPAGPVHHYRFRLFALDAALGIGDGKTKAEVEAAMQGHILAQTLLTGTFGR